MKKRNNKYIKVLLIEDNRDHAQLIQGMLADASDTLFDTDYADRLSRGLECLGKGNIDVVLLDLSLPDSQGLDTFLKVNKQAPDVPVVVLSALNDETIAIKAVQAGAQDYLEKLQADGYLLERSICYAIERNRMMAEVYRLQREWENIFQSIGNPMTIIDPKHVILAANHAVEELVGKLEKKLLGKKCYDVFQKVDYPCKECPLNKVIKSRNRESAEIKLTFFDKTFLICCTPMFKKNGEIEKIILSYTDITERKQAEEQLQYEAIHDSLSGLFNRRYFMKKLVAAIHSARRYGHSLSVCLCDLDEFKAINDTYGHRMGDDVISAFGKIVSEELRGEDIPGRYGGDEFGIIFPHILADEAMASAERIRRRFKKLVFGKDHGIESSLSATFGIVDLKPEHVNEKDILKSADQALYKAKELGRNCVVTWDKNSPSHQ